MGILNAKYEKLDYVILDSGDVIRYDDAVGLVLEGRSMLSVEWEARSNPRSLGRDKRAVSETQEDTCCTSIRSTSMRAKYLLLFTFLLLFSDTLGFSTFAKEPKVLICGVCKDVEPYIANTKENIETLGRLFADYRIIIYENNSTDATKVGLQSWAATNSRLLLMSETLSFEELSKDVIAVQWNKHPFRTELIAKARNKVLDAIRDPCFVDYDFVIMADLDFSSRWPIQEIYNTIVSGGVWDVVCANGVDSHGQHYDQYALRTHDFPLGPELLGDLWWKMLSPIRFTGKDLVPVYSAFGGLAIYKKEKLLRGSYAGRATTKLSSFYQNILQSLPRTNRDMMVYLNLLGIFSHSQQPISVVYREDGTHYNSGSYGAPAVCEHVVLHAGMMQDGGCNIFINPRMTIKY